MKIIMLKGLPASGKSTWAKKQQENGGNYMVISKDEIRDFYGGYKPNREKEIIRTRNELIRLGIKLKKNVIVDDTNLNPKHEQYLKQLARELNAKFQVNDEFLKESPEDCISRDLHRGDKAVGSDVIWKMYYEWVAPVPLVKLNKEFDKPRCVICEIDDCIAFRQSNENIADPFMACVLDSLCNYGVEQDGKPYPSVFLVSGQSENVRGKTEKWLSTNLIPYDKLFMRNAGDKRPDEKVKEDIYLKHIEPEYSVLGVFDSHNKSCRMWRGLGLRVAQLGNMLE